MVSVSVDDGRRVLIRKWCDGDYQKCVALLNDCVLTLHIFTNQPYRNKAWQWYRERPGTCHFVDSNHARLNTKKWPFGHLGATTYAQVEPII